MSSQSNKLHVKLSSGKEVTLPISANYPLLTQQEIFDCFCSWFFRENYIPCVNELGEIVYKNTNNACPIGIFLPDLMFKPEMNKMSVDTLVYNYLAENSNIRIPGFFVSYEDLLSALQTWFDDYGYSWREDVKEFGETSHIPQRTITLLRAIAWDFKLNEAFLNKGLNKQKKFNFLSFLGKSLLFFIKLFKTTAIVFLIYALFSWFTSAKADKAPSNCINKHICLKFDSKRRCVFWAKTKTGKFLTCGK